MSGDRYYISDQQGTYFLTFTIVEWIDIFSRKEYRDIIVDSLNYCVEAKGLRINAWVIMTNHIHLVARSEFPNKISETIRDFKKFTSKKIVQEIQMIGESRRDWLLDKFAFEARKTARARDFKVWKDDNHAIELGEKINIWNKINYIHENPVRAAWVYNMDDYLYSSARNYAGKNGLVKLELV